MDTIKPRRGVGGDGQTDLRVGIHAGRVDFPSVPKDEIGAAFQEVAVAGDAVEGQRQLVGGSSGEGDGVT